MLKKLLSYLMMTAILLTITACSDDDNKPHFVNVPSTELITNGTVEVIARDNVRYHVVNFTGGYTSTMVETGTGVVLVDVGPSDIEHAGRDLRAYANTLQKAISVIITHNHGDHFGNIDHFQDVNVYALSDIATALMQENSFSSAYSRQVLGVDSMQTISGLDYHFAAIANAETVENAYISIPSEEALFVGDLIYKRSHPYLREYTPLDDVDELTNWINGLHTLKAEFSEYRYLFVGHSGYSETLVTTFDENIDYLTTAQGLIKGTRNLSTGGVASSNQQVIDELEALYSDYDIVGLYLSLPEAFFPGDPGANWFQ